MSTEISPQSESYLQQMVDRGVYRDRAEAIDQAVELLKRRDQLRADVHLAVQQADRGELIEADDVFQRLLERAHQIEAQGTRKGMSRLVFTPIAEADLNGILDYIAEHRPLTAVAVMGRIRQKCDLLASQPLMGQERPEFAGNYRSFPVERWVIFYRVVGDTVEVHRIVNGARDLDSLIG